MTTRVASGVVGRGSYGVDAPYVPALFAAGGLVLAVPAVVSFIRSPGTGSLIQFFCALFLLLCGASYLYTTRRGKFVVWSRVLADVGLRGDERVLDLGCGRGAVLIMAAHLVPRGRAIGVDLWKSSDQSGNAAEVTRRNAGIEGVADRVELHTADMTDLPLGAAEVDMVVSSLAIHNIKAAEGRSRAVDEAVRVLRPGGRLVIADIRAVDEYAARLTELGLIDVSRRRLGWRFWYGGPWVAASLVTATKPS